jgi:hypothetical protein
MINKILHMNPKYFSKQVPLLQYVARKTILQIHTRTELTLYICTQVIAYLYPYLMVLVTKSRRKLQFQYFTGS